MTKLNRFERPLKISRITPISLTLITQEILTTFSSLAEKLLNLSNSFFGFSTTNRHKGKQDDGKDDSGYKREFSRKYPL